jgi:hypothetical protein
MGRLHLSISSEGDDKGGAEENSERWLLTILTLIFNKPKKRKRLYLRSPENIRPLRGLERCG